MGEVLKPETLALFLFFIVPGFVAVRVYDLIVPSERRNFGESFVDLIAYSLLILTVWFLPFYALVSNRDSLKTGQYYGLFALGVVLVVVISPVVLAVAVYKLRTADFFRGRVVHPSPTGWDWFFGKKPRTAYILFHLKSGEVVGGFFGGKSAASSYPNTQQVYIEEVWNLSDDYKFLHKVDQTNGAIINKEDCNVIELFVFEDPEGSNRGEEDQ